MKTLQFFSRYQRLLGFALVAGVIAIEYFGIAVSPAVEIALMYFAGALGIARPSEMAARGVEALRSADAGKGAVTKPRRKTAKKTTRG